MVRRGPAARVVLAGMLVLTISCGSASPSSRSSRQTNDRGGQGRAGQPQPVAPALSREYVTVSGDEQIAWDQEVPPGTTTASMRFLLYVDRVAMLLEAKCQAAGERTLSCQSPLPKIARGRHRFEITASILDTRGTYVESFRSPAINVFVGPAPAAAASAAASGAACALATGGVDRIFAADKTGVWRVRSARVEAPPAIPADGSGATVIALATHPKFQETGHVYVLTASAGAQGPRLSLSRYHDQSGVLGDRAVLFDGPTDTRYTRGRVRFDDQGKVYVGAWVAAGAPPPAPLGGIVLRLTQEGKVPPDSPDRTGVILRSETLAAFELDPDQRAWVIEQTTPGRYTVRALGAGNQRLTAALPLDAPPSQMTIGGGGGANMQIWVAFDEKRPVQVQRSGRGITIVPAAGSPADIAGDLAFGTSGLVGCAGGDDPKSGPRVFEVRPSPAADAVRF